MDNNGGIAKAYAQGLFQLASAEGIIDKVEDELTYIKRLIVSTPKIKDLLNNSRLQKEEKKGIVLNIFNNNISHATSNHLNLVIDQERQGMLLDIIEEFFRQVRIANKKTRVDITIAMPIADETAKMFSEELSRLTGKEIEPAISVDESILGGVIVRIGDRMIDGSLKTRLERLRHVLLKRVSPPRG